jgi:hypothetical protein
LGAALVITFLDADDTNFLAPSASALRIMLDICDNCAIDYSVMLNASKSKCQWFYFAIVGFHDTADETVSFAFATIPWIALILMFTSVISSRVPTTLIF